MESRKEGAQAGYVGRQLGGVNWGCDPTKLAWVGAFFNAAAWRWIEIREQDRHRLALAGSEVVAKALPRATAASAEINNLGRARGNQGTLQQRCDSLVLVANGGDDAQTRHRPFTNSRGAPGLFMNFKKVKACHCG